MPGEQCLDRRPPPPRLVNPAFTTGEKIDKQKKKERKKVFSTKTTPREIGALESSGPIAFAPLKFAPTSWAGAPSKACARGPWPPLPPPSVRHCQVCIVWSWADNLLSGMHRPLQMLSGLIVPWRYWCSRRGTLTQAVRT